MIKLYLMSSESIIKLSQPGSAGNVAGLQGVASGATV